MQVVVRARLNMGIALAGAGAIALAPIAQPLPAIAELQARAVSSTHVALTAAANPIEQWAQIIRDTLANGGTLVQSYLSDPLPILHQVLNNGLGYGQQTITALQGAFSAFVQQMAFNNPSGTPAMLHQGIQQILAGQFADGVESLYEAVINAVVQPAFALLPLMQIPVTMAKNLANAFATVPQSILGVGLGALGIVSASVTAVGASGQAIIDAVRAGDLRGVIGAIVAIPGTVVGAILNGVPSTGSGGLLGPYGLVSQIINAVQGFARALAPPAPTQLALKVAATSPSALPSAALSVATATLAPEKVTTPETAKVLAAKAASAPAATAPAAQAPAATAPAAQAPAATAPETAPTATDAKPETKPETKPESGTTSGSTTTPNGGTDTTNGKKAKPGKPRKPSGSTGSETGSGSTGSASGHGASGSGSGAPGHGASHAAA
ncbi:putative membrane protein YgcG [Mycobacterium sp. MAA66]|uniref:hypothetical protein n=1 Tax=Mycobacterium sp. MAA66 TaxID=3156297 RepID=UPI003512858E